MEEERKQSQTTNEELKVTILFIVTHCISQLNAVPVSKHKVMTSIRLALSLELFYVIVKVI